MDLGREYNQCWQPTSVSYFVWKHWCLVGTFYLDHYISTSPAQPQLLIIFIQYFFRNVIKSNSFSFFIILYLLLILNVLQTGICRLNLPDLFHRNSIPLYFSLNLNLKKKFLLKCLYTRSMMSKLLQPPTLSTA